MDYVSATMENCSTLHLGGGNGTIMRNYNETDISYIVILSCSLCLALLGICGNGISYILFSQREYHRVPYCLFRGLAIADASLCVIIFLDIAAHVVFLLWNCSLSQLQLLAKVHLVIWFAVNVSTMIRNFLLVHLMLARFSAVHQPLEHRTRWFVEHWQQLMSVYVLLSVLCSLPRFVDIKTVICSDLKSLIWRQDDRHRVALLVYNIGVTVLLQYGLPMTVIAWQQIALLRHMGEVTRQSTMESGDSAGSRRFQRTQRTHVRTILALGLLFIVCQSPSLLDRLSVIVSSDIEWANYTYFLLLANLASQLDSSINLLVYYKTNRRFQQVLDSIWEEKTFRPLWHPAVAQRSNNDSKISLRMMNRSWHRSMH